jgi:hypothetical protein
VEILIETLFRRHVRSIDGLERQRFEKHQAFIYACVLECASGLAYQLAISSTDSGTSLSRTRKIVVEKLFPMAVLLSKDHVCTNSQKLRSLICSCIYWCARNCVEIVANCDHFCFEFGCTSVEALNSNYSQVLSNIFTNSGKTKQLTTLLSSAQISRLNEQLLFVCQSIAAVFRCYAWGESEVQLEQQTKLHDLRVQLLQLGTNYLMVVMTTNDICLAGC